MSVGRQGLHITLTEGEAMGVALVECRITYTDHARNQLGQEQHIRQLRVGFGVCVCACLCVLRACLCLC